MEIIDIDFLHFGLGLLLLLIPAFFLAYFKTGLVKSTLIAAARMIVQLFLIGFYLGYLFEWNNIWINLTWIIVMSGVASYTVLKRTQLPFKQLFIPVSGALLCSIFTIDFYFLGWVVQPEQLFETRYFIPISGMILGNMLSANVIALNSFYGSIRRDELLFRYRLGNGATQHEACIPFIREALKQSFSPTIASMSVMGLIALPGTMTGQILGGSAPDVAIKYQIMIMITIFASSLISVLITLWVFYRRAFDKFGNRKY